jgi:hypothetical protein
MFCMLLYHFVNHVFLLLCYVFLLLCLCVLIVMYVPFWVLCFIVPFCVLFVCKCVLYYCHRMSTQLQSSNVRVYHSYQTSRDRTKTELTWSDLIWGSSAIHEEVTKIRTNCSQNTRCMGRDLKSGTSNTNLLHRPWHKCNYMSCLPCPLYLQRLMVHATCNAASFTA